MDKCGVAKTILLVLLVMSIDFAIFIYTWDRYENINYIVKENSVTNLDRSYSSLFCDAVNINSDGRIDAFYYEDRLKVVKNRPGKKITRFRFNGYLDTEEFKTYSLSMLPGSKIFVSGCAFGGNNRSLKFRLFSDENKLKKCISYPKSKCLNAVTWSPFPNFCRYSNDSHFLIYEVTDSGKYYFLLMNEDDHSMNVFFKVEVSQTYYDTSEADEKCLGEYHCIFAIPFASEAHIAVENVEDSESIVIITSCVRKWTSFALFFAIIPTAGFVAIYLIWFCLCSSREDNFDRLERVNRKWSSADFDSRTKFTSRASNNRRSSKQVSFAIEEDTETASAPLLHSFNESYSKSHQRVSPNVPSTSKARVNGNVPKRRDDVYNQTVFSANKQMQQNQSLSYPTL